MKSRTKRVVVLVLVFLALSSVVLPPVLAQSSTTTATEPTTTTDPATTTDNSGSGGGGGDGGDGDGKICFFGKCIPEFNPIETITNKIDKVMEGFFGWIQDSLEEARDTIAEKLVNLINKIPAPGDIEDPLSWNPGISESGPDSKNMGVVSSKPDNERWVSVYEVWFYTILLAAAIFLISGTWLWTAADPYQYKEMGKSWAIGIFMAIMTWFICPLILHLTRALSTGLAPDAAELTSDMSLELGLLVGLITAIFAFGAFVAAFVALAIQYFLAFFLVAFWPLAWALRTTRNNMLVSIGDSAIYMFGLLQVLYVMQALILRFSFEIQGISPNIGDTLFAYIAAISGIYIALVKLPPALLRRAMRAGVIGLGGASVLRRRRRKGPAHYGKKGYGYGKGGYEKYKDWRGDDEPDARDSRDSDASPDEDPDPDPDPDGRGNRNGDTTVADGGENSGGFSARERRNARYGGSGDGSNSEDDDGSPATDGKPSARERKTSRYGASSSDSQQSNYSSNRDRSGGVSRRKRGGSRRGRNRRERRSRRSSEGKDEEDE